ncbi:MAG: o-succinylbenzoate synthase [Vicinamibacteria bacterium]|nr:o-succinylbenzoate synthase [Vicinamibacteria bacterium]
MSPLPGEGRREPPLTARRPGGAGAEPISLQRIELRVLALPMRQPFETSFGVAREKRFLLVSIHADGLTGHGECVADHHPGYLPETIGTAAHVLRDYLAPLAFAAPFATPQELVARLRPVRGHEMAKAALEMAAWDLCARRAGVSLATFLGGTRSRIAAGVSIGLQRDDAALVDKVAEELAAGYHRVKVKIKPGRDQGALRALRHHFPDLHVVADANSAYTLEDADHLARLDTFAPAMLEQPLGWDDVLDHAVLAKRLRTPICLDESLRCVERVRQAIDIGAAAVVNLKPGRVGGLVESVKIHDLCVARGVPLWCGGMVESGLGRTANVHLQSLPGFDPGDTSDPRRYFDEDLVEPPVVVAKDGFIDVPQGPGLGVELITSRLERATQSREALVP